jgi:hypothetical protein
MRRHIYHSRGRVTWSLSEWDPASVFGRRRRRIWLITLPMLVLLAALATGLSLAGHLLLGLAVTGPLTLIALLIAVLLTLRARATPLRPGGGWSGGGSAGVREPRRPLPMSPAGAAAIPLDD